MTRLDMKKIMALFFFIACPSLALGQHEGDIIVGRTSQGQLVRSGFDSDEWIVLAPVSGLLRGWTGTEPGFDRLDAEHPSNSQFPLVHGARINLELIAADPAIRIIDNAFGIVDAPGEAALLGDHALHTHVTWHVNSAHPAFNPGQCLWRATFRLRDEGHTHYAPSEPFTLQFVIVAPRQADGDFDENGQVNDADHMAFVDCLGGMDRYPEPTATCDLKCLNAFDFDADGDVDLADAAEFQSAFNAASR